MQLRLFPDPKPLVEKLGWDFFRKLPATPAVYLMKDERGQILYVGKAKNLRKRLSTYLLANPDRMKNRILRLIGSARAIEWIDCESESAALKRESELILELKPRFNRAGVWRGPTIRLAWRSEASCFQFEPMTEPLPGWMLSGSMGWRAASIRATLHRLFRRLENPTAGSGRFPPGWFDGAIPALQKCGPFDNGELAQSLTHGLEQLFLNNPVPLTSKLESELLIASCRFDQNAILTDLDLLMEGFSRPNASS